MARSSPEKLAAALRANLKRRKEARSPNTYKPGSEKPAEAPKKPSKKAG